MLSSVGPASQCHLQGGLVDLVDNDIRCDYQMLLKVLLVPKQKELLVLSAVCVDITIEW